MEILKSLIFPLKMRKYRSISIFISLLIFVLTIYLLMFSYRIKTNSLKLQYIQENTLELLGLYELEDSSFDYSDIKSRGYVIKDQKLTTSSNEEIIKSYQVTYTSKDGIKRSVNIYFDPYNLRDKEIEDIRDDYYEKYDISEPTKIEQNKAYYLSNMLYAEMKNKPETNYEEAMANFHNKTLEELEEASKVYTVFELYQIPQVSDAVDYVLIFNPNYLIYAAEADNEKQNVAASVYYIEGLEANFSNINTIKELGQSASEIIISTYVVTMQNKQNLNFFLSVLLLPFLLVFIVWLVYRRSGVLKTYKEYYNIAAISSIVPSLIVFVLSWIWLDVMLIQPALVLVFYVFVLYRINSSPEI